MVPKTDLEPQISRIRNTFLLESVLENADNKALREGGAYNFGFAVHDDNITTRGHHVPFPVTPGFGATAAIEASRIK